MAVVGAAGDGQPLLRERDVPVRIHVDQALLAELFHGDTDAGLGIAELVHDIDRAHFPKLFLQHQNGFKVVFGGFTIAVHEESPF